MRSFFAILTLPCFAQVEIATFDTTPPAFELLAPATYEICWDINWSPYAGGQDLLFALRLIEKGETTLLEKSSIAYSKSMQARTFRLSELIALWLPLNWLAILVQHEVFGHGYRIRDIPTARVTGYAFDAPPPYGEGGAVTYYAIQPNITTTQGSAISIAGVEANAILAQLTKLKWLEASKVDPRQSILYLLSEQDLTLYISTLEGPDIDLGGHDLTAYVQTLNQTYPDTLLTTGKLKALAWINLADPLTYYALYSWFHYLSSGKETPLPMIANCYLPNLRLGLTPFGPEIFLENYFALPNPLYAYLKAGHHADNIYLGLGAFAPYLWTHNDWALGLRIDLWRQPKLLLLPGSTPFFDIDFHDTPSPNDPLYPSSQRHAVRYGGAASLLIRRRLYKIWGFEGEFGYKAQGFLPGYSLKAYPTIRLAYSLAF